MKDLKLVLVSQPTCKPCIVLKNQINERLDELEKMNVEFEYIDLSTIPDKDTFIQSRNLTCTPTIWLTQDDWIAKEFTGYVDVDTLFSELEDIKGDK